MITRGRLSGLVVVAFAIAAVTLAGQQPSGQPSGAGSQTPTFRSGIDAVTVDAIVTDKQGRPVTDLTVDDFEVLENKRPQSIQSFKLVKVDEAPQTQSSFQRDIQSMDDQRREAAREDTRLLVIFLDDYHVRIGNSLSIKQQVARFVNQLTPNDLVAVVYPLTPANAITFTRNHESTAAAIMGFIGRKYNYAPKNAYEWQYSEYPPPAVEQIRNEVVITALRSIAMYLGTLKEGKKTILYVSEGMTGSMPQGVTTRGDLYGMTPAPMSESQQFFAKVELNSKMQDVFSAAARSNTSIYTLDARGLAIGEGQINDNMSQEADRAAINEAQDSLRVIASNTDGRYILNRNEPLDDLKRMTQELSAYYLLGYTSSEAPRDGKFHEIQVRVKRKDIEVRARKGYWAYTAEDAARALAPAPAGPSAAVEDALSTLSVPRDHPVRVWTGSQRGADGKASVTLVWEPLPPSSAPSSRLAQPEVVDRVIVTATSIQGDVLFRGPVPGTSSSVVFDAPPGTVQINLVAEDAKGTRLDRDDLTIDVPDFTKVSTAVGTPLVFRGRTARDIQQIRAAAAPVPTVGREFSRTERLLLRFQAYAPGGTTPAVTLRFLNNLGRSMSELPAPTRLPDGTFESEIGLGSLAPGKYLVEVTAKTDSESAQALVPLQVTP